MLRVYGSRISYYTGKVETYLRYRSLEYELLPTVPYQREVREGTGTTQMPAVRLADGRWMSDSTPILAWLDMQHDGPSIYPEDPGMRFVAMLVEDYADEWLWRSAMHYRWSYRLDRQHLSALIADEQAKHIPLPRALKRLLLARRQRGGFVRGDGVTDATWDHVEQGYRTALERLEAILARRRFLLGDAPSIADFGMMAPMLRHFGQDPTPAEIMRSHAPGVYAWVARMWHAKARDTATTWISDVDAPLADLLREVCETHLVQLRENAIAVDAGERRYSQEIQGQRYERVPSSRYRVWCLEQLRRAWRAQGEQTQAHLRPALSEPGSAVLWDATTPLGSNYDPDGQAPFNRTINVFGKGVPR